MKENFYITTTLPYVNAEPHVGFASEIIYADVRARFEKESGKEVVFNTGTDEHGIKIWQKAQEEGVDVQSYVDGCAERFDKLKKILNLSYTNFIRTTDEKHVKAAQEMWKRVEANGYIYKKQYSVKYCVGCELEKTDSELEDGFCPLHPGKELELIEEENYFFKFSEFEERLLALYENNPEFVVPNKRLNEIKSFVSGGLQDFSISRVASKMPWGVAVPGDDTQVMYVWFDALTNYISTIGWPVSSSSNNQADMPENSMFEKFWGSKEFPNAVQIAGKDNLRQQSAMWQAMLMAADLPNSKQIFINGFIVVDGQKMSKSIGNVISPKEMVERYGVDGTRYLLLSKGTFGEDNNISWDKMDTKYNADLANGLGNLTSRVVTLLKNWEVSEQSIAFRAERSEVKGEAFSERDIKLDNEFVKLVEKMDLDKALEYIWKIIRESNKYIEDTKPWELVKQVEGQESKAKSAGKSEFKKVMKKLVIDLNLIAELLKAFMPETSDKIKYQLETKEKEILFERIK